MTTQDVQQIDLALIELSGGTQSRAGYDEQTLAEYIEAWKRGVQFPPIDLYFDGEKYYLADGFHRVASRKRANIPGSTIAAIVHQGTRRDAVLHSVGANATHGLKRTNADKRRAVMTLLRDPEWATWTNTAIANACGVDEGLVRLIKSELSSDNPKIEDGALAKKCGVDLSILEEARSQVRSLSSERTARRNGKSYTVDTAKIGKVSKKNDSVAVHVDDLPQTGWDISPQQLSTTQADEEPPTDVDADYDPAGYTQEYEKYASADFSGDVQTESVKMVAPRSAQTATQMLSAAVEACLGEFSMPQTLDEPLQGKVYISPGQAVGQWAARLLKAYKDGMVQEAIALLPLDHRAFTKFADYALCPLPDRLVAVYLGRRVAHFVLCFEDLGTVWHRYGWRP